MALTESIEIVSNLSANQSTVSIANIVITNSGIGYTQIPNVVISAPVVGSNLATANVNSLKAVAANVDSNNYTGYSIGNLITVKPDGNKTAIFSVTDVVVSNIDVANGGSNYTVNNKITFGNVDSNNSNWLIPLEIVVTSLGSNNGDIFAARVVSQGVWRGSVQPSNINASQGELSEGTLVNGSNAVFNITWAIGNLLLNSSEDFARVTSNILISDTGNIGLNVSYGISNISVTNNGKGYTPNTTITFVGNSTTSAQAVPVLSATEFAANHSRGIGYYSNPLGRSTLIWNCTSDIIANCTIQGSLLYDPMEIDWFDGPNINLTTSTNGSLTIDGNWVKIRAVFKDFVRGTVNTMRVIY